MFPLINAVISCICPQKSPQITEFTTQYGLHNLFINKHIMSTRHIVRISPLHTSILLTIIYCLVAIVIAATGLIVGALNDNSGFLRALQSVALDDLLAGILLNVLLVFIVALIVSTIYNFLAKYLGGIEITLDDDWSFKFQSHKSRSIYLSDFFKPLHQPVSHWRKNEKPR